MIVGEPYWHRQPGPEQKEQADFEVHGEYELLQIMRQEGWDLAYVVRASRDDWDRYEAGNWQGLLRWLRENSDHPERQAVIDHLRESQDWYLNFAREYIGWAIYVLEPQWESRHAG